MPDVMFHLWSNKRGAWWRGDARGYTHDQRDAGLFTEAEALQYVLRSAYHGRLSQVTCMVVAGPRADDGQEQAQ